MKTDSDSRAEKARVPSASPNTSPPAAPATSAPGFAETLIAGFAQHCGITPEKLTQFVPVQAYDDNGQAVLAFVCHGGARGQVESKYHLFVDAHGIPTGFGRWVAEGRTGIFGTESLKEFDTEDCVIVTGNIADAIAFHVQGRPALAIPGWEGWNETHASQLLAGKVIRIFARTEGELPQIRQVFEHSAMIERSAIAAPQWTPEEKSRMRDVAAACIREPVVYALEKAQPATAKFAELKKRQQAEHAVKCSGLLEAGDILGRLKRDLEQLGFAGYLKEAFLVFLAMTSRVLDRPISVFLKGSSSTGKSYTVDTVKRFFPPEAYFSCSSFTPKALVNSEENFAHRMIIVAELDGVASKECAYTLRTLVSENKLSHMASSGSATHLKEKPGPTGLILTSTKLKWHEENETRMISVTMPDDSTHTKLVLESMGLAAAGELKPGNVNLEVWGELQRMLDAGKPWTVLVPFAPALSSLIPPVACRLRRDFAMLLTMVKTHALLHYGQREKRDGAVIATLDDYDSIQKRFGGLFAETVEKAVPARVRATVLAVKELMEAGSVNGASLNALAQKLNRNKSTLSRNVKEAIGHGYLMTREGSGNCSERILLRDPLPEDRSLLPTRDELETKWAEMKAAKIAMAAEVDDQPATAENGGEKAA